MILFSKDFYFIMLLIKFLNFNLFFLLLLTIKKTIFVYMSRNNGNLIQFFFINV